MSEVKKNNGNPDPLRLCKKSAKERKYILHHVFKEKKEEKKSEQHVYILAEKSARVYGIVRTEEEAEDFRKQDADNKTIYCFLPEHDKARE